jgi:hypothetical protein
VEEGPKGKLRRSGVLGGRFSLSPQAVRCQGKACRLSFTHPARLLDRVTVRLTGSTSPCRLPLSLTESLLRWSRCLSCTTAFWSQWLCQRLLGVACCSPFFSTLFLSLRLSCRSHHVPHTVFREDKIADCCVYLLTGGADSTREYTCSGNSASTTFS